MLSLGRKLLLQQLILLLQSLSIQACFFAIKPLLLQELSKLLGVESHRRSLRLNWRRLRCGRATSRALSLRVIR